MDDDFTLEDILEHLDDEVDAEVLSAWATTLQNGACQCYEAAKLAVVAEDGSGYQHWFDQGREYSAALWQVRERLCYLRDRTSLELQWLIDALPPEASEDE
jgi:hypothetical protein